MEAQICLIWCTKQHCCTVFDSSAMERRLLETGLVRWVDSMVYYVGSQIEDTDSNAKEGDGKNI